MRHVDRLVIKELFGPWIFGVAIFSTLILAGSFLFELTRYIAQGANIMQVAQLAAMLTPGVVAKTFPMAVLLATLLAFGRLSGDSEIVALRAGGVSLPRIIAPVGVFGFLVSLLTVGFNELVVPRAAQNAEQLKSGITQFLSGRVDREASRAIVENGKFRGFINAVDFDAVRQRLRGVAITTVDSNGNITMLLQAPEMQYEGNDNWRIIGEGTLTDLRTFTTLKFKDAWPRQTEPPKLSPEDLLAAQLKNLDALSMQQMAEQIKAERQRPDAVQSQIYNLEFGYWNKIAIPFSAFVFGLLGAPLGVRSHRTGTATGFWQSVLIIFGYLLLSNIMSFFAQGGLVPSWSASFAPVLIGLVVAAILTWRKDQ